MCKEISPFLTEILPQKKLDFIWFSFLTSLSFIEVYDCEVCYLFHGENLASPYECSNFVMFGFLWTKYSLNLV